MTQATEHTPARRTLTGRVWAMIDGLSDQYRRYSLYRRTLSELRNLSTRELKDLGIERSMITRLAAETAYTK